MIKYFLIFGGGKFGKKAVNSLITRSLCIVIDSDPNCLISKIAIRKSFDDIKKLLESKTLLKTQKEYQHSPILLQGDIRTLVKTIEIKYPEVLIPTAPIHIMKFLIKDFILRTFHKIEIYDVKPKFDEGKKPPQLNSLSTDKPEIYLSYAKWDEVCPDNCKGPLDYCPYHKRKKPITVTKFIEETFISDYKIVIESIQLAPGLGGIKGEEILSNFNLLEQYIKENSARKLKKIRIIVGTACNCHGVVSGFILNLN